MSEENKEKEIKCWHCDSTNVQLIDEKLDMYECLDCNRHFPVFKSEEK